MFSTSVILASILAVASAHPQLNQDTINKRLPDTWFQPRDHPVHGLFKRQSVNNTDGMTYPAVGSAQWTKGYPSGNGYSNIPAAWVAALNASVAAGKIPNIPASTVDSEGFTHYAGGLNPNKANVCSGTYQCQIPGDLWQAPTGMLGCGFDDGPLPPSDKLYAFLKQNNQKATHFFIGQNILQYYEQFLTAFGNGDDIAVHTWTHPYMTTRTNMELLAEFGWTMEIIHNSTGGRLPRFWRPPYGDTDVRVAAIAKEVFGLTAILWDQDTNDWALPSGTSLSKINASMTKWLTGPKTPGLIILEHELSTESVQAFIDAYPVMISNGWNVTSVAEIAAANTSTPGTFQNALDATAPVTPASGIIVGDIISSEAPSLTASSTAGASSTGGSGSSSKSAGVALHASSLYSIVSLMAGAIVLAAVPVLA